ncbi:MAG: 3-phosphoshikimate 1-carboxyvinyltransferase [Candidatus Methanospirareceae archaeon]
MRVVVKKSRIVGRLNSPPSKSYTHRAIAIACLGGRSEIFYPLYCEDTRATMRAAEAIGAEIYEEGERMVIEGTEGMPKTPEDVIYVANSGTTLRFFTAITSLCEGAAVLTGDASLRKRPNYPLLRSLKDLGAEAFSTKGDGTAPIVVRGKLKGGETIIDASISSQFVSALLIACPLTEKNSYIIVNNLVSEPYIRMTLEVLKEAGVDILFHSDAKRRYFEVGSGRRYDLRRFIVPGDFSSAAFLLAAAAITDSELLLRNLFPSAQGDERIVEILRNMGAEIEWRKGEGEVVIKGAKLRGIEVDLHDTPDLMPIIAVLGAVAEGVTRITNVEHLRYKETDRLRVMGEELKKMGVKVKEERGGLLIKGGELKGAKVDSHGDHRVAMALSVAGLVAEEEMEIEGVECVNVSYPSFFEDLLHLGADIELL